MAKKRAHKRSKITGVTAKLPMYIGGLVLFFVITGIGAYHYVRAYTALNAPIQIAIDPNLGIRAQVIEFFKDNDAEEMIDIIKCESRFKQFEDDGTPLKNKEGSSAIGVAQILDSAHPDPKIIERYNREFNTNLTVEDLDITTLNGNIGYALVLYEVRGTRDWECAKKFRF